MPAAIGARSWGIAVRVAVVCASIAGVAAVMVPVAAAQASGPRAEPDSRRAEAMRALAAGDTARALDLGTAYLEQHPGDAEAHVLLARVHIDRDELDAAYVRLARVLRAHPRHVDALYYLGLVTAQLAAEQFERVVEGAPASARAHQLLAETLEAQERRPEAEREYEAALAAKPDLVDALLALAKLKRIRLDCEGAIALYTKAEALRPSFDGAYGIGSCAMRQADHATALAQFERAVARDPRAAIARVGLGSALLGVGRTADAIASLERAVVLEPKMGEAFYILGRAYQAAGDRTRAEAAFAKADQVGRGQTPEEPR
jgi:tetratricopeptide (TPR) repeat protein